MTVPATVKKEETLDPQDWDVLRKLGYQMVDDMMSYLENIRERPSWQPLPPEVKASFTEALPLEPQGADSVYRDFKKNVLPFPMGNIHPRFWAWVSGTGSPGAMLADMLASGMNSSVIAFPSGASAAKVFDASCLQVGTSKWCRKFVSNTMS